MCSLLVQNGEDEVRDRQEKYHGLRVSVVQTLKHFNTKK